MAKRFEPRVKNIRIDSSVSATINTTRTRTYVGIEAKTGPYTLQNIQSTKQLVQKFSTKSKPSKSDGVTMLHAGKITQEFAVDVLRVNKDKIHPGIDSTGNTLFFDEKYNLIKNLTKLNITPAKKNLATQALLLVIDGVLYYNGNAYTDLAGESQTFYEYQEDDGTYSWTPVSGHRGAIITGWKGPKYLIGQNNTDLFLDEVYNRYLKSDSRFIKYTNTYNRTILLSGYPLSPYNDNLKDYLVQYDINFLCNNEFDYTRDLIEFVNNGVIAEVSKGEATLSFKSDNISTNRLFKKYADESNPNNQIVYNGVQYYSYSSEPSKVTGIGTQLIKGKDDVNYRDGILGAITAIYNNETKLPSINLAQSVVIKSKPGSIFVYRNIVNDAPGNLESRVIGDLEGLIKLEVIGNTDNVTTDAWMDISEYTEPSSITAATNNYLRITFSGSIDKVKNAAINLVVCSLSDDQMTKKYDLYSMAIGDVISSDAITIDLSNYTEYEPINAIVPNLVAQVSELGEEQLPVYDGSASDGTYQKNCYYRSNVDFIEMSTQYAFSFTGYVDSKGANVITKTTSLANILSTFISQDENMEINANNGVNYILIDNVVYYNYSTPNLGSNLTFYKISSNKMTSSKFISELITILYSQLNMAMSNDGYILINGKYDEPQVTYHNSDIAVEWINSTQSSEAKFAVVQKFTSAAALSQFSISFDEDDQDIINLYNVHGTESSNDTISFDPDKVNGFGVNLYYDKFNRLDRAFHITELSDEGGVIEEFESEVFGNEITPKVATIQDYIDALDTLRTIEYKPSFVFDAGLSNIQYYKSLNTFAEEVSAMIPAAAPCGSSYDEARTWKSALGFATERFVLDGWQRDVVFGDISFQCSPTYYYLQLVLSNVNSVSREFQPIYGVTQGRVETSDPVVENNSKGQREELLDLNVNSIVRNNEEGYSYINSNYTDQSYESDFSEEQNVRISNKIAHIADAYVKAAAIAKNNSIKLWDDVTLDLTGRIQKEVVDNRGTDTIQSFTVICNETNNNLNLKTLTVDVMAAYRKSINEVLVYNRTVNLEG